MRHLLAILLCLSWSVTAAAQGFDSKARALFVLDETSDTVLLDKNADEPYPPASMSKLMTLYMLFEALQEGRLGDDAQRCALLDELLGFDLLGALAAAVFLW